MSLVYGLLAQIGARTGGLMEEDEDEPAWPGAVTLKPKTLNEDPYNVYAEELAMEVCKLGFEVAAELLETDLVFSSCGHLVQGTPDGGFRDAEGLLRLVQVVRVPLLPEMDEDEVAEILYDTVLTKVVKSQVWMKETGTLPHDFTIFCWLPPVGAYQACLEETEALLWTDALIWNLRAGGWPFSLVIQVPEEPGRLFPRNFGFRNFGRPKKDYADEVKYFLVAADFEEDDEEDLIFDWDLFELEQETLSENDTSRVLATAEGARCTEERSVERMLPYVLLAIEFVEKQTTNVVKVHDADPRNDRFRAVATDAIDHAYRFGTEDIDVSTLLSADAVPLQLDGRGRRHEPRQPKSPPIGALGIKEMFQLRGWLDPVQLILESFHCPWHTSTCLDAKGEHSLLSRRSTSAACPFSCSSCTQGSSLSMPKADNRLRCDAGLVKYREETLIELLTA